MIGAFSHADTFAPTSVPRGSETTGSAAYAFAFATDTYAFTAGEDAGRGSGGDPSYGPASGQRMELNLILEDMKEAMPLWRATFASGSSTGAPGYGSAG